MPLPALVHLSTDRPLIAFITNSYYLCQVKKFLLSIVTMLYMTMSSGIAMEIHYCMGKQAGIDFYDTAIEKCGRCGMKEKKGGCCSDEHKFYKLADAHKNVSSDDNVFVSPMAALILQPSLYPPVMPGNRKNLLHTILPQSDSGPPIFIRNCVFRI